MQAHRYHDISDEVWEKTPHLSGGKGSVGRLAKNSRQFINVVFRILYTGSPQGDLPPDSGHWSNTYRRFCHWRRPWCLGVVAV